MANAVKKTTSKTEVVAFDPSFFEADASQGLGELKQEDLALCVLAVQ